jgi:hypothetical protein
MKSVLIAASLALVASAATAQQTAQSGEKSHAIVAIPDAIKWVSAPPSLPAGARLAVLEGNPAEPGPFTMRLEMPSDYRIAPHYHPVIEHVTVITGEFYVGMGETFDASKANALPTGTFAALAPGMRHFALTKSRTIIQLHGVGPWSLVYVNAADDPRNKVR